MSRCAVQLRYHGNFSKFKTCKWIALKSEAPIDKLADDQIKAVLDAGLGANEQVGTVGNDLRKTLPGASLFSTALSLKPVGFEAMGIVSQHVSGSSNAALPRTCGFSPFAISQLVSERRNVWKRHPYG